MLMNEGVHMENTNLMIKKKKLFGKKMKISKET